MLSFRIHILLPLNIIKHVSLVCVEYNIMRSCVHTYKIHKGVDVYVCMYASICLHSLSSIYASMHYNALFPRFTFLTATEYKMSTTEFKLNAKLELFVKFMFINFKVKLQLYVLCYCAIKKIPKRV